jgi:hypothetical protein
MNPANKASSWPPPEPCDNVPDFARNTYVPQNLYTSSNTYNPPDNFNPTNTYSPRESYNSQNTRYLANDYNPPYAYNPRNAYDPPSASSARNNNNPQNFYNPPSASNSLTNNESPASTNSAGTSTRKAAPILVAVFGKTGAGKTSFIKSVTGLDLKVGHSLESCTYAHPNTHALSNFTF